MVETAEQTARRRALKAPRRARPGETWRHYSAIRPGELVDAHGTVFRVTAEGPTVRSGGHGCRMGACGESGRPYPNTAECLTPGDAVSEHATVWFVGEAVTLRGGSHPIGDFVRKVGDPWTFQYRGDLAWLRWDSERRVWVA